jgi:hypothetical protein
MIPKILLSNITTFNSMIARTHNETYVLLFIPILLGVVAYHIGSKNSTSNGLTMAGLISISCGILFYTFDPIYMQLVMTIGGVAILVGLLSQYVMNKRGK